MAKNWEEESVYIDKHNYIGTDFFAGKLFNLDTGEVKLVILPVDYFIVDYRGLEFEIVNLKCCEHLKWDIPVDRVDIYLKTKRQVIQGNLGELAVASKPLHDRIDSLYS